jgi:hypothetical protein
LVPLHLHPLHLLSCHASVYQSLRRRPADEGLEPFAHPSSQSWHAQGPSAQRRGAGPGTAPCPSPEPFQRLRHCQSRGRRSPCSSRRVSSAGGRPSRPAAQHAALSAQHTSHSPHQPTASHTGKQQEKTQCNGSTTCRQALSRSTLRVGLAKSWNLTQRHLDELLQDKRTRRQHSGIWREKKKEQASRAAPGRAA